MNSALIDRIAQAVLYEGYILYPYRPTSVKNRQRWTFGGIVPRAYADRHPGETSMMQAQCLLKISGDDSPEVSIKLRFLHLMDRTIERAPAFERVSSLRVGDRQFHAWQEAVEREVVLSPVPVTDAREQFLAREFSFDASRAVEEILDDSGRCAGRLIRIQHALAGRIECVIERLEPAIVHITARVLNLTGSDAAANESRDEASMRSFASTHLILSCDHGQFISLTDPPEPLAGLAQQCTNIACWPVLVGEENERDAMLASPIILPDYPQIAPESPGDLFDGTEIDEILSLRIMTLTDEEKRQAASVDARAADLLARTESLAREQLMGLHGTMRQFSPVPTPAGAFSPMNPIPNADPFGAFQDRVALEKILSAGIELRPGDRVRLHPRRRADIFDIALSGKLARIASIEQDFENRIHLAVTIDEDPGSDLGLDGKPGHRFFFSPEEVEVVD